MTPRTVDADEGSRSRKQGLQQRWWGATERWGRSRADAPAGGGDSHRTGHGWRALLLAGNSNPTVHKTVNAVAALSALGGAFAGAHPTGLLVADPLVCGAAAGLVSFAAARSTRTAWILAAGIAALFSSGVWFVCALAALLLATFGASLPQRSRILGAIVGGLTAQALLRLPDDRGLLLEVPHHGASAVVGLLAGTIVVVSGYRRASVIEKRKARRWGSYLAVGVIAAALVLGASVLLSLRDIDRGLTASRQGLAAARGADTERAADRFEVAATTLGRAHDVLGGWWLIPVRAVPVVGQHAQALDDVTRHAEQLAVAAQEAAETGDYHDLRYESGGFDLTLMTRLRVPLRDAADALTATRHNISGLPVEWLLPPLRSKVDSFDAQVRDAEPDARLASEAVAVGPRAFGGEAPRRYLMLFTTPAEQRGLGGFIGAYGELTAEGGRLRLSRSGPIDDLINARPRGERVLRGPTDYIRRYGGLQPQDFIQDMTLSPDFPSVAEVAADVYEQSTGRSVAGVVQLDPYGLSAFLKLTGPVQVPGLDRPLTAADAPELLLRRQYVEFKRNSTRQDLMGEALRATFQKLTKGDLPGPRELGSIFGPAVREGRLMLWAARPDEQRVVRRLHADGAMARTSGGDFVSVRGQNSAHNKIDAYLDRSIDVHVTVDPATGLVKSAVTVKLHNRAPASGLPRYVIGNDVKQPTGTNQMTLTVYSPLQPMDATIDGVFAPLGPETELGWNLASLRVVVPPGATSTVVFNLSGILPMQRGYHLRLVPQPTATTTRATVRVDTVKGWRTEPAEQLKARGRSAQGAVTLRSTNEFATDFERAG